MVKRDGAQISDFKLIMGKRGLPERIRTSDLWIRSPRFSPLLNLKRISKTLYSFMLLKVVKFRLLYKEVENGQKRTVFPAKPPRTL